MSIIMGGSGSTGSSLVKNILNRHPDVFAGGETSFFAKRMIYENWNGAKNRISQRGLFGLRNFGYHIYNGTDLEESEYLLSSSEIKQLAESSDSLSEFCNQYYSNALTDNIAKFWIEKTPANSACFDLFLTKMDTGKVIHMVRNPYDTIASLWARGYELYYAVGIYLLNTGSGLQARKYRHRYHEVRYEEVVRSPQKAMANVCSFLDVSYHPKMIESQNEKIEISQLSGWKYDETADIGTEALGRFAKLPEEKQMKIIEAVNLIQVSDKGKSYYGINIESIGQICERLGYEFIESSSSESRADLSENLKQDRWTRIKRGYKTGFSYPLELRN